MDYETDTYNGFTKEDLIRKFIYDPVGGTFFNRRNSNPLTSTQKGRLVLVVRDGDRIVTLSAAKVALLMVGGITLKKGETVKFIDNDPLNLAYSNIVVVAKETLSGNKDYVAPYSVPTETDGVFQIMPKGFFVARRGSKQAVYRTNDYDEAVAIRKEWETDKNIHKWDNSYTKFCKSLLILTEKQKIS